MIPLDRLQVMRWYDTARWILAYFTPMESNSQKLVILAGPTTKDIATDALDELQGAARRHE